MNEGEYKLMGMAPYGQPKYVDRIKKMIKIGDDGSLWHDMSHCSYPHLLTPVVTDMREAASALRWCVAEMERRYKLMSALGVRNLGAYRSKNTRSDQKRRTGGQSIQPA